MNHNPYHLNSLLPEEDSANTSGNIIITPPYSEISSQQQLPVDVTTKEHPASTSSTNVSSTNVSVRGLKDPSQSTGANDVSLSPSPVKNERIRANSLNHNFILVKSRLSSTSNLDKDGISSPRNPGPNFQNISQTLMESLAGGAAGSDHPNPKLDPLGNVSEKLENLKLSNEIASPLDTALQNTSMNMTETSVEDEKALLLSKRQSRRRANSQSSRASMMSSTDSNKSSSSFLSTSTEGGGAGSKNEQPSHFQKISSIFPFVLDSSLEIGKIPFEYEIWSKNQCIQKEGAPILYIYWILEGTCSVTKTLEFLELKTGESKDCEEEDAGQDGKNTELREVPLPGTVSEEALEGWKKISSSIETQVLQDGDWFSSVKSNLSPISQSKFGIASNDDVVVTAKLPASDLNKHLSQRLVGMMAQSHSIYSFDTIFLQNEYVEGRKYANRVSLAKKLQSHREASLLSSKSI